MHLRITTRQDDTKMIITGQRFLHHCSSVGAVGGQKKLIGFTTTTRRHEDDHDWAADFGNRCSCRCAVVVQEFKGISPVAMRWIVSA